MHRRMSSRATIYYKIILPVFWIGGFAVATVAIFASNLQNQNANPAPIWLGGLFLGMTVVGAIALCWVCVPLKVVWLEDGQLCVSNYLRTEHIPLADIDDIQEWAVINIHPVIVRFGRNTGQPRTIQFIPPQHWLNRGTYPIVEELREAVSAAHDRPM